MDWLTSFDTLLAKPDVRSELKPPASLESIQAFETALAQQERVKGLRLPPSYQAFLLRYDGGIVDDDRTGFFLRFFNVEEYDQAYNSLMEYNGAESVLMDHEIETYFTFEPLVIIATDQGDGFWALDPSQQTAEGEMPVRFCDHETGDIYAQSDDFASFILAIATHELKHYRSEKPIVKGL